MNKPSDRLYAIAEGQQGYFTAAQAVTCGYPTANHGRQCRHGVWQRERRGIYRLARYPASPDGPYVLWSLWSRSRAGEPQGVYSHQTALSLYDLSDLMPGRLHLTVPPGFRRNTPIPPALVLHKARFTPAEIEQRQGYRVVRPLRTIADLLHTGAVERTHLSAALRQALERGLIPHTEFRKHPAHRELQALLAGRAA
jgi:predicted transcriptional regulator of viral defense system